MGVCGGGRAGNLRRRKRVVERENVRGVGCVDDVCYVCC